MELEAGDMLDLMEQAGHTVFGYRVVSPFEADPDLTDSYNHGVSECPVCGGSNTYVIRFACPNHPFLKWEWVWYCKDCFLVWESVIIGRSEVFVPIVFNSEEE
ncbi:MAG: hypothetical protein KKH61_20590 [Gammaproteobacteria bacterium]|nr:hypothetical protein [Gammaproteobacteria bacterium]